jgi:hypothetical protein
LSVDPAFTPTEQCYVQEAAARWSHATGGIVDVSFWLGISRDPGGWDVSNHTLFCGLEGDARYISAGALGYTERIPGGKMWLIQPRIVARYGADGTYAASLTYAAMHELGHHLGLHHNPSGNLMAGPRDDGALAWSIDERGEPCITQRDVDDFCALYGCSVIAPPCGLEPPVATVCE